MKAKDRQKEKEEETEGAYKWWEEDLDQNVATQKWMTLEHNVDFPTPYQLLPSHAKMKYNS
jgi:DNA topoisomerase IB